MQREKVILGGLRNDPNRKSEKTLWIGWTMEYLVE